MTRRFDGKRERVGAVHDDSPFMHQEDSPPHALSCLAYLVGRMQRDLARRRMTWPSEIPAKPIEAAAWWIEHQEPCADDEQPGLAGCAQTDVGQRWETPYLNRIHATMARYCSLPDSHRDTIIAAHADGVFWRGETVIDRDGSPGHFIHVYDDVLRARQYPNLQAYVQDVNPFGRMREAIRGKAM